MKINKILEKYKTDMEHEKYLFEIVRAFRTFAGDEKITDITDEEMASFVMNELLNIKIPQKYEVPMDELCELTSRVIENNYTMLRDRPHSITDENGEIRYVDEAQDMFNETLDIIDNYLNDHE